MNKLKEQIFHKDKYVGIIHQSAGKWYLTLARKNLNLARFRTCGNGVVREAVVQHNHCSQPMTWDTRESVLDFLREIQHEIA